MIAKSVPLMLIKRGGIRQVVSSLNSEIDAHQVVDLVFGIASETIDAPMRGSPIDQR